MIPVIYPSPSLAWCLAKALCSTKLYYAATALCVLLGATKVSRPSALHNGSI